MTYTINTSTIQAAARATGYAIDDQVLGNCLSAAMSACGTVKDYQVIEDNGGGITLVVWGRDGKIEYMHSGYEYVSPDSLRADVQAIIDGNDDTDLWDGCIDPADVYRNMTADEYEAAEQEAQGAYFDSWTPCNTLDEVYESSFTAEHYRNGGWHVVADNDGVDYDLCGHHVLEAFPDDGNAAYLAAASRNSQGWDIDILAKICKLADMSDEWEDSDGDTFEGVAFAAADKLGIDIV